MTDRPQDPGDPSPGNQLIDSRTASFELLSQAANSQQLFAVLDVAGSNEILTKVLNLPPERCRCLYLRAAFRQYWAVAPYLVEVDTSILSWIVETVWEEPWGILALATQRLTRLHDHFRRLLLVQGPEANLLYFRFYDPRVLGTFLTTCTPTQLDEVYGPVSHYGIKNPHPGSFTLLSQSQP